MVSRAVRLCWLVGLWVALWGDVSVANILGGLVVALAVIILFRSEPTGESGEIAFRPLKAAKFAAYFAYKLVESSIVVAVLIVNWRRQTCSGIVAVPLKGCSDTIVTLIAAAISLTPGTLTLDVRRDPLTLYVHVLHITDVEEVHREVRRLEVLAVEAFGTRDALARLVDDDIHTEPEAK